MTPGEEGKRCWDFFWESDFSGWGLRVGSCQGCWCAAAAAAAATATTATAARRTTAITTRVDGSVWHSENGDDDDDDDVGVGE